MDGGFGDIFRTEEELLSGEAGGQVMNSWESLPRNCADKLPLPEIARKQGYPIGLKNQGATCYLNSLFQVLYHTPELRDCILRLPLCLQNAQKPSKFVSEQKQSFLLGFQRLFSQMSLCDKKSVGTDYINKAFGWEGSQHTQQNDIQEAMRVIFDTILRALNQTEFYQPMQSLFRTNTIKYKNCSICEKICDRAEQFFDISLQVKGIDSVEESLKVMLTAQSMSGDNAIFCETCQHNTDQLLGSRLQQLPGTFVLTLNRFDFDYEKMDRVRLNTYFQFQLEMDLSQHLMPHPDSQFYKYELSGVVIHRGTAHGGHYTCYVRDLREETNWQAGLKETQQIQAKIHENSTKKQQKAEDKKQKQEQKVYKFKQPSNKKLLENWYQINDNVVTAIDANKIASKYEGSDSAYILFYRRKSLKAPEDIAPVPSYFGDPIREHNKAMDKEREVYQTEKQQIILNIQGEDQKLMTKMTLIDFKQAFVAEGVALVMQSEHNGLPYYPMQIVNKADSPSKQDETIQSLGMPHQSRWKQYEMSSSEYVDISSAIGKDRLPLELLLLVDGQEPKRIVSYSDENFLMLRMKLERLTKIAYENQTISLVSAYDKQRVLTDNVSNDQMILPKLGIYHASQLHLRSKGNEDEEDTGETKVNTGNLLCFVIERDDIIGLKRFYFEKNKTLEELFKHFLKMEGIKEQHRWRFRNLNGNRLFYTEHFSKALEDLQFSQELVRLRLERGQIPIKGDVLIKINNQSTLLKKDEKEENTQTQRLFDPNTSIKDVKGWACLGYNLDPVLHKLYLTDWMKQPIRSLNRDHLTLFEANFGREEIVCLRDIYSPIGEQLVHLQMFSTTTGCPDTANKDGIHVKIQQFKTVKDLKELLINFLQLGQISLDQLRLRQIKRDYMFGSIWRDLNKSVKSVTINSNKVVYQVLSEPEHLNDNQIVVALKTRNRQKRTYEGVTQLIFEAGKIPNIEDFTTAIKQKLKVESDITITKYVHHQFQWIELSRKNIQLLAKKKKGKQQGKDKGNQGKKNENNKKKDEESNNKKENKGEKADEAETIKEEKKQTKPQQCSQKPKETQVEKSTEVKSESTKPKWDNKKKQGKKNDQKGQKPKNEKKGGKGEQTPKDPNEECQNLRKAPVLLKDGDMIGWGLASELEGDLLQTDEDAAFRIQYKKHPGNVKGIKQKSFGLGVKF